MPPASGAQWPFVPAVHSASVLHEPGGDPPPLHVPVPVPVDGAHVDALGRCCFGTRGVVSLPPSVVVSLTTESFTMESLTIVSPDGVSFDPVSVPPSVVESLPWDPPQAARARIG